MKLNKLKLAIAALALLFIVSGCANETEQLSPNKEPLPVIPSTSTLQLVTIDAVASCQQVELQNSADEKVEVTPEIEEAFECVSSSLALSPDNQYLLYDFSDPDTNYVDLELYDLKNKESEKLMSFNETLEGLDCIWHNNSQIIACVAVNQMDYAGLTKVFVLTLDEAGKLSEKQVFPQEPGETVDFVCGGSCYPGKFWFENDGVLKYEGHNIISPDVIYQIDY